MLRVTTCNCPGELRLHLEGRLAGPWVQEAASCWQSLRSTAGPRAMVVDLRDVDYVDGAGEQLLVTMYREGAGLVAASPMMTHLMDEIVAGRHYESGVAHVKRESGAAVSVCYRKKK